MKNYIIPHLTLLGLLALLVGCQPPTRNMAPGLLHFFPSRSPGDTLHIEISQEDEMPFKGDTIPNHLFFSQVPSTLLAEIDYLADSSQAVVLSRQQFPVNDSIIACWVEIRQFWFQHQSLFLFQKNRKAFTDRVTLAEWYGGEGGQVLIGSWMFDYDGDGDLDLVRREMAHSMSPGDEEPIERLDESATLLLWKNGRFVETAIPDTASFIRRYPIRSAW